MTNAEYAAYLAGCDFRTPQAVSRLVTSTHTNVMFDSKVVERQIANPLGATNYYGGLFGKEVWPDGIGNDMIREYYAAPYVPFTFSRFTRSMQVCDPNLANECDVDFCKVPEGGRGTMPPFRMLKWGFETERDCVANIRHIRDFRYWASRVIQAREQIDEQTMNMFYTLAAIQTAGHKIVMQGYRDATDGNALKLISSSNPRNPLRFGSYNYMQELFPQITNVQNLVPLQIDHLDRLARYWSQYPKGNDTGVRGPRGEMIWEMWYPDDWYEAEVLRNPDYIERIKYTKPANLFAGTKLDNQGEREILKNWAMKCMPWLPRFAPDSNGNIVPVDSHTGVNIEVGQEFVGSIEFEEAPIGLAMMVSSKQGTIITRPTLTTSGAGFPIQPISGNSGWIINNEYDPVCNKLRNKPFSYKYYEMGFRMDDPDAAMAFLFRRRKFNLRAINECDFAPIFTHDSDAEACPITTIGCNSNREREYEGITDQGGARKVECTFAACGNGESGAQMYRLRIKREANMPDYNSLGCECGAAVTLFVHDANGAYLRQVQGVLKDTTMGFPYGYYFVETAAPLATGECIKGVSCTDATPLAGEAFDTIDNSTKGFEDLEGVLFFLDSPIACPQGSQVTVRYYNNTGHVVGTVTGAVIAEAWHEQYKYRITSNNANLKALNNPNQAFAGAVKVAISCSQAPNASSSSSGTP
jgi:hypothetical protein